MKKIHLQLAIIALFLTAVSSAFAGTITSTGTTIGGANFKASTGITLNVATSGTPAISFFGVASKHINGDKSYSATSVNPSVLEAPSAVGTGTPAAPTS